MLTVAFGAPSASEVQQLCDGALLTGYRQGRWCDMANTDSTYHSNAMHKQPWTCLSGLQMDCVCTEHALSTPSSAGTSCMLHLDRLPQA